MPNTSLRDSITRAGIIFAHWLIQRATVGAVIVLERNDEVLLVRSGYRSGWHLPGGYLAQKEPFEAGIRREVMEELGIELSAVELVEIVGGGGEWPTGRNYAALFRSSSFVQIRERPSDWEVLDRRWFKRAALPDLAAFPQYCIDRTAILHRA